MARLALKPHPDAAAPPITIVVDVVREASRLYLMFALDGAVDRILLSERRGGNRVDGLWRSTCMEAFIRFNGNSGYLEFNFAPSLDWASYQFDDYRSGMRAATPEPLFDRLGLFFRAECDLSELAPSAEAEWRLALAAVIEETDGTKSYWALAHAPGPPDFHNPACFTATLPPPAAP